MLRRAKSSIYMDGDWLSRLFVVPSIVGWIMTMDARGGSCGGELLIGEVYISVFVFPLGIEILHFQALSLPYFHSNTFCTLEKS